MKTYIQFFHVRNVSQAKQKKLFVVITIKGARIVEKMRR